MVSFSHVFVKHTIPASNTLIRHPFSDGFKIRTDGDLSLEEGWAPTSRWRTLEVLVGIQHQRSHKVKYDAK